MNLIESLHALEAGKKVAKKDWSKGTYLYMKNRKIHFHRDGKDTIATIRINGDSFYKNQFIICKRPFILDETEKKYLENVLSPFKNKIEYIDKIYSYVDSKECLRVALKNETEFWCFPNFEEGTMYKDMEVGKEYTLKELGLFE